MAVAPTVISTPIATSIATGDDPPSRAAIVVGATRRGPSVEAPHGAPIALLAATPDGGAVVSVDRFGSARLWPVLDGIAEPRVIDLPPPKQLAIGRAPRGFAIAVLDAAGGLSVHVVAADGLAVQRAVLPLEPTYAGVAAASRGFIAWRTDQRIVWLDGDGAIGAELVTEPGQRLVAVAVAGERTVAVIETGRVRRARWVERGRWGAWLAPMAELGERIAVSPSGQRLATLVAAVIPGQRGGEVVVYDTTTGALVAQVDARDAGAFGVPSDTQVALGIEHRGAVWTDLTKPTPRPPRVATPPGLPPPIARPAEPVAFAVVAGGQVIAALGGQLVIATPRTQEFLGYDLHAPQLAAVGPSGLMLIGLHDKLVLVDANLRGVAGAVPPAGGGTGLVAAEWLGDGRWLTESGGDGAVALHVADPARGSTTPALTLPTGVVERLRYEPSTRLVTLSTGPHARVVRYEPSKPRLAEVAELGTPGQLVRAEVFPVAPALAGGVHVVAVEQGEAGTKIRWAKDPAVLDRGAVVTVAGGVEAVGPAGHVFTWERTAQGGFVHGLYRDGVRLRTLPARSQTQHWPDPSGTAALQLTDQAVMLVGLDGVERWSRAIVGLRQGHGLWLGDGSVAVVGPAGMLRLDAATGEVRAARCGWRFGRTKLQHPEPPGIEPVCTQVR